MAAPSLACEVNTPSTHSAVRVLPVGHTVSECGVSCEHSCWTVDAISLIVRTAYRQCLPTPAP